MPDIGRKFSNRDHTTVIHAVKKIDELIKKDNEIRQNNRNKKKIALTAKMEFTIDRDTFLKSLGHANGIIEKKTTLPILSNIY